jgi:NAD-dependent deacetylase sirtuin 2
MNNGSPSFSPAKKRARRIPITSSTESFEQIFSNLTLEEKSPTGDVYRDMSAHLRTIQRFSTTIKKLKSVLASGKLFTKYTAAHTRIQTLYENVLNNRKRSLGANNTWSLLVKEVHALNKGLTWINETQFDSKVAASTGSDLMGSPANSTENINTSPVGPTSLAHSGSFVESSTKNTTVELRSSGSLTLVLSSDSKKIDEISKALKWINERVTAIEAHVENLGLLNPKLKFAYVVDGLSLKGIANYISSGLCKKILVMCGAGISVSAGIPDFRSPGIGLYDNLEKYRLTQPTDVFTLDFFKKTPEPFFDLSKELFPGKFKPTIVHHFIRLLSDKNLLLRNYTQNIDCLERISGVPEDKIVEAHGTFVTAHCLNSACKKEYKMADIKDTIFANQVPKCTQCQDLIKPDITFFGENLPNRYHQSSPKDFPMCDMLIVLGTSLKVKPFCKLIDSVPTSVPRLLINREKVAMIADRRKQHGLPGGFMFDEEDNYRDVSVQGDCDRVVLELAAMLGWKDELLQLKTTCENNLEKIKTDLGFNL